MTASVLDGLAGVGPARRSALLQHFGSAKAVGEATPEQIAEVPGIGRELADSIWEQMRRV